MKCVIPGANCKILGRAIHALAKIGEEMYVEPKEKSLSLKCVGAAYSAYCEFTFRESYFSSYNFGNLEEEDALKCKITMRSALTVFKSPAMIDKLVETCHIRLEPNADKLIFIFKFKNSVIKTFFLPIIDCEDLRVPYTKTNIPNKLSVKSKVLTDAVQNFQHNLIEITMEVTPQKLLMRNYVDDASALANLTRTQLALTIGEFDEYTIGQEARITFCMKELRAMLSFAETVGGLMMNIYFETTGKPVVFDLTNPTFETNLVLSTLNADGDDMSVSTSREVRVPVRKRAAPKKKQPTKSSRFSSSTRKPGVSNRSVNATSNLSARPIETNPLRDRTEMEVDRTDDEPDGANETHLNRVDSPALRNNSRSIIGTRQVSSKRSNVDQSPSSCRLPVSNHVSPMVSSLERTNGRTTEPSIFSPSWKKQSGGVNDNHSVRPMDDDVVPASPPPPNKKARIVFKKCFNATFDPRMLPGHDMVLADDSDDEN